jgi:glycosyltransferase involved in cell wall biosynthesis
MKIVIVQGAFFPIPPMLGGAVEKIWFKLAKEFARLGHEVTHISREYNGLPSDELVDGVQYVRVRGYSAPKSLFVRIILDAFYSLRAVKAIPDMADVIVTNTFWAPIFLCNRKKSVVYASIERMPKGQMRLYSRANRLRANSTAVADAIKRELPVSRHCIVGMVPNPIPLDASDSIDFSLKERLILYCGRVHPEKGIELLGRAFSGVKREGWRVQIVGPWETDLGGGGAAYKRHLEKCFDECSIEFLGPVFDEDRLIEIYRMASIFIYPSIAERGETFGLAPLEAMSFGVVPIVSDLACFKDFIKHGENGVIFDHRSALATEKLRDAIKLLIDSHETRERIAKAALNVRESHSIFNIAQIFTKDFRSLIYFEKGGHLT